MSEYFQQDEYALAEHSSARVWSETLTLQAKALQRADVTNRPWMYCELHNPWSRSATAVDSWALLDLCQSAALLEIVTKYLGDDVVLFDSQIQPIPALEKTSPVEWHCDSDYFPLDNGDGCGGVVVRIPFGPATTYGIEFAGESSGRCEYRPGQVVLHGSDCRYRLLQQGSPDHQEYLVRYYSARRHFDRDPSNPRQIRLMERLPWINYSRMPHWLVRGQDYADNDFVTGFHTKSGHWTMANAIVASS